MSKVFEGDLLPVLLALGDLMLAVLLICIWLELRQLKQLLEIVLTSNRENSRSMMAAIHEGVVMLRHAISSEPSSTKSKTKSREGAS